MIASIDQGDKPLTALSLFSKMNMALTSVALVVRPCVPRHSAGRGSSSSRSRLAKSNGRFAPLDLKQDCFFRVSFTKQHSSYSLPTTDKLISSTHSFTEKLLSDSFQKLRILRNRLDLISSLHSELILPMSLLSRRSDDFQNRGEGGGSARSGQKNFQKVLIHRQNIKSSLLINSRLFLFFI